MISYIEGEIVKFNSNTGWAVRLMSKILCKLEATSPMTSLCGVPVWCATCKEGDRKEHISYFCVFYLLVGIGLCDAFSVL